MVDDHIDWLSLGLLCNCPATCSRSCCPARVFLQDTLSLQAAGCSTVYITALTSDATCHWTGHLIRSPRCPNQGQSAGAGDAAASHLYKLLIFRPSGGDHIGLEVHFGNLDGEMAHAARAALDQHPCARLGSTPRLQCLGKIGYFQSSASCGRLLLPVQVCPGV